MTVSVCMGLYNGEEYIEEQLQSIYQQSCPADEVILCDDGSDDGTVELVRRFISDRQLEDSWHLMINEKNLGYPGNFYHAMELCTGDLVFLADQDDVWMKEKIRWMKQVFENLPDAALVSCGFGLIDASGGRIHTVAEPDTEGSGTEPVPVSFRDIFYEFRWPGMVLAYRNADYQRWKSKARMLRTPHDLFLCCKAAEEGGFYDCGQVLAMHRRHDHNAGGEEHRMEMLINRERKLAEIETYLTNLQLLETEGIVTMPCNLAFLDRKRNAMVSRQEALRTGSCRRVLGNALHDRKLTRLRTVICDLLICLKS